MVEDFLAIGSGKEKEKLKEIVEISSEASENGNEVEEVEVEEVGGVGSHGKADAGLEEGKYRKYNNYKDDDDDDDDIVFIESVFKGDFKGAKPKGDLDQSSNHKRSSATNAHHSSPDVVFVSQKRIVIPFGRASSSTVHPPPLAMDFSICYGMLASRLINVNIANCSMSNNLKALPFSKVFLRVKRDAGKPFVVLEYYESQDRPLAELNDTLCRDLSPLLGMLRFECRACVWGPKPEVRMILYGSRANALYIGRMLSNHSLVAPDVQPSQPYFNPQIAADSVAFRPNPNPLFSNALSFGGGGANNDDSFTNPEQRRLQHVFKTIVASGDLDTQEPDSRLSSQLYKYQKQGLRWMVSREKGEGSDVWLKEGPSWRNILTSRVATSKPAVSLGGVLGDDMGLGKTIQIIALILTSRPERAVRKEDVENLNASAPSSSLTAGKMPMNLISNKPYDFSFGFVPSDIAENMEKAKKEEDAELKEHPLLGTLPSRSTLIVCPLSLIHNWEDQILTHTNPGSLKVLVFHGQNRTGDAEELVGYDVVITTYNILASGLSKSGDANYCSPLHRICWFRVVLDEAHIIKSQSTLQAKAAYKLKASIRWCLTGTPLQNKLDDLYSLIRFLKIEPLNKKAEWLLHISKPIQSGRNKELAFSKLQLLMKIITLRRTKTDMVNGKPIIQLPPRSDETRLLVLEVNERKLYDKVHRLGQQFFERLQAQGTDAVMKEYIQILTAILKMRQACLHPRMVKEDNASKISKLLDEDEDDFRALDDPLTLKQSQRIFHLLRQVGEDSCVICSGPMEGAGNCVMPCKHLICSTCIQDQLQSDSGQSRKATSSKTVVSIASIHCPLCRIPFGEHSLCKLPEAFLDRIEETEGDDEDLNSKASSITTASSSKQLPQLGVDNAFAGAPGYMPTKVRALLDDLTLVREQDPTTKSVVFSQFTSMLDLCQKPLRDEGFKYVRLDGAMSRATRADAQNEFKNNKNVTVFLISIKAGGVGLNLTTANRVYMLEPNWNPSIEQQAIDRVHRLGQTRPVATIRFIIDNSIEINMQNRQKYKSALADKALDSDDLQADGMLSKFGPKNSGQKRKRGVAGRDAILKEKMESLSILFRIKETREIKEIG